MAMVIWSTLKNHLKTDPIFKETWTVTIPKWSGRHYSADSHNDMIEKMSCQHPGTCYLWSLCNPNNYVKWNTASENANWAYKLKGAQRKANETN